MDLAQLTLHNLVEYGTHLGMRIIAALVVFTVGRFVTRYLVKIALKIMNKRKVDASLFTFVESLLSIALSLVLAITVISVLGIETSSFVAIFASAGVAIGMAMSGTLQNFAGGVMILLFHPYRVGDYIEAQGYAGTVSEIQIFNTILKTPDNQTIIIPNGGLSTGSLKNFSTAAFRRVDIDIEVAYGTNPDDVRRVLNGIIDADDRIKRDGAYAPTIPMTTMSSSSIVFQMRVWTASANYWAVRFDTIEKAYRLLGEAGIEIPFQQVDVHVKA